MTGITKHRIHVGWNNGRWLVLDGDVVLSDWDDQEQAALEVNRMLREELRKLLTTKQFITIDDVITADEGELSEVPQNERGFGV